MIYLEPDPEAARIAEEIRVEHIKKRQDNFLKYFSPISLVLMFAWFVTAYFKVFSYQTQVDLMAFALGPVFGIGMAIDLWFDYERQSLKSLKTLAWEKSGKLFIVVAFPLYMLKDFPWVKPLILTAFAIYGITIIFQFAHFCTEGYRIITARLQRKKQKKDLP